MDYIDDDPSVKVSKEDEDLLKHIRDRYEYLKDCWSEQREKAKQDTLLMANKPFTQVEIKRRGGNRPLVLTDQLGQYTNQITNSIRQNPRGINVTPKNLGAAREAATRRANLFRGIERDSDAQAAYCTMFDGAVAYGGMGFLRLTQKYESVDSDQQVLRIDRVPNQFSIVPDHDCQRIDFSDMKDCFVLDTMRHSEFRRDPAYQGAKIKTFTDGMKSDYPDWIQDNELKIAEYWQVKHTSDVLLTMETGSLRKSKLPAGSTFTPLKGDPKGAGTIESPDQPPVVVRSSRAIEVPAVWQYHTNGVEVLRRTLWDDNSDSIPIYICVGREMYVDEGTGPKKSYVSAVRFTAWAIKGMAYVRSLQTEIAQMTPKTPYMAIEGQLEGMSGWKTLNTDPQAYLYYKAKLAGYGDMVLPPPTRVPYDPRIEQLEILFQAFQQDLQNALGMYRASVGNQTGSNSGKMVQELDKQSDQGSFHFTHNYNQTLERLWTDINNRVDKVYDTTRQVGGVRADGTHEAISLNDPTDNKSLQMGQDRFDIALSIGPSMESEQEDARVLLDKLSAIPDVFAKVGDLAVKLNGKGPIVDQIAERLKPPGVDEEESTPEEQAKKLQMAGQQIQQLQGQLQEAAKIIQTKQIEAETKIKAQSISSLASIRVAEINNGADMASIDARMLEHATGLMSAADQAEADRQHELKLKAVDQQHDATQADANRAAASEALDKKAKKEA